MSVGSQSAAAVFGGGVEPVTQRPRLHLGTEIDPATVDWLRRLKAAAHPVGQPSPLPTSLVVQVDRADLTGAKIKIISAEAPRPR